MTRVAITGVGFINSLGTDNDTVWSKLCSAESGIHAIKQYDPSALATKVAGEVVDFNLHPHLSKPRSGRLMNKGAQLAILATAHAMIDSGADWAKISTDDVGVFLASENQISGTDHIFPAIRNARLDTGAIDYEILGREVMKLYPLFFVEGLPAATLYFVSEQFGFTGASAFYTGAADTGLSSIGAAFRAIKLGVSTHAVAGAFDEAAAWWSMIRMEPQGVLASASTEDVNAYRPFTEAARGRILGDGACVLVLENMETARKRDARVYAEITGFGAGSTLSGDAVRSGAHIGRAIDSALKEANRHAEDVDVVLAHGAAMPDEDEAEASAIKNHCGEPAVTCVHPATGHQLAAAGAFNAAIAALSLSHAMIPPTLVTGDLAPYAPPNIIETATGNPARVALALGHGMEGQSVALTLKSVSRHRGEN